MNVAEQQYTHKSPDKLLIIDPGRAFAWPVLLDARLESLKMRWHFKGKAPISFKVVFALFGMNVAAQIATTYAIQKWSPTRADAVHSYLVRFKGDSVYFVQQWVGNYFFYGGKANYVFLAVLFLIFFIHRDQVERVR
jgi:hypothetical protein